MQDMLNKEEAEALENAIRSTLITQKSKLLLSDDAVGKIAFSFMKNPRGKVQALLVGQGAGDKRKPQYMKISDIVNLCESLGLNWADVIRGAIKEVKKLT